MVENGRAVFVPASKKNSKSFVSQWTPLRHLTRTKTIATVGPACATREALVELIEEGVDVFRLNMAHGSRSDHQTAVDNIRAASLQCGTPVGILVDLAGPKIRLGQLREDPLNCIPGKHLTFVRGDTAQAADELVCSHATLIDEIGVNDWIMLRDGLVRLQVVEKGKDFARCVVVDGGSVRSRQGVNLPGVNVSLPALGKVDIDNARWAAGQGVEFVSLSFVRTDAEIGQLRSLIRECGSEAQIVAKIEKREALTNLDAILIQADVLMVARGDLGVEIDVEKTPMAQKKIIRSCRAAGKTVIVATQMLESMHDSPQPTRAEVSDVANAILDGADACMLSGETAIGNFPRQAVRMMRKVMSETEKNLENRTLLESFVEFDSTGDVDSAVIFGAAQIARRVGAKLVVIATANGQAARIKSAQRDFIPTVAVTDDHALLGRLALYWGITPFLSENIQDPAQLRKLVEQWRTNDQDLAPNDCVVFVVDTQMMGGIHDLVMVVTI